MTLAQPPYAEETDTGRPTQSLHTEEQHVDSNVNTQSKSFYLRAQAYSALEQLTEFGNQLAQHRNVEVLQTLRKHDTRRIVRNRERRKRVTESENVLTMFIVSIIGDDFAELSLAASMALCGGRTHESRGDQLGIN